MSGAVSFDLDGTLWEFEPMMEGALAATIAALEQRRPDLAGRLTNEILHEHRAAVAAEGEGSLEELRRASFRRALRALEAEDEALADWMSDRLLEARADAVEVHADVEPAIAALEAAGYVVGAITNGNFPFHRLDLARRFRFVIHAEELGQLKPAAAPFAEAVRLAGFPAARCVHVGDHPEFDVAAAQAFGMRAVWLNRIGARLPPGVEPDAEVTSLDGLLDVVRRLLDGVHPAR